MSSILILAAVGVFVASIVAFVSSLLIPTDETTATEDRLTQLASAKQGVGERSQSLMLVDEAADASLLMQKLFSRLPAVHQYLEQGDVKLTPTQYIGICIGFFIAGMVVCLITPVPVLLGPFVGGMLMLLPIGYLIYKRNKRLAKFGQQIPAALELLARSLRAGHSLQAGFGLVGDEMQPPLAIEFKRCYEEQKFGIPIDESVEDMAERIPNMDVRFFATAVILQRQTGGDLSEILDKIGHLVRERLQILGQIQALTGEGRMSGIVLLGLPPVLFIVMLKLNYEYVMTLFSDPMGQYMLGAALLMQLLGALVIKKIITIKV